MKEATTNCSEVNDKHVSTLLAMDGKEHHEDNHVGQSAGPGSRKLLYTVDEVPPPGILLSVALQVGTTWVSVPGLGHVNYSTRLVKFHHHESCYRLPYRKTRTIRTPENIVVIILKLE